jgi:hypothetical protein
MCTLSQPCLFWATIVIQVLSAATIIAIQQSSHGRRRTLCQRFFFGLLMAMGVLTALAAGAPSQSWMTSGATLSIMTVFATRDMGSDRRRTAVF